jgi:VanZ family protein
MTWWRILGLVLAALVAAVLGWAAFLLPQNNAVANVIPGGDLTEHVLGLAALSTLVVLSWPAGWRQTLLVGAALSGLAELVQPFVGRSAHWPDFLSSLLGLASGTSFALAVVAVARRLQPRLGGVLRER